MKKRVISTGMQISDNYRTDGSYPTIIKANGRQIEAYRKGYWTTTHICNSEVELLLWLPNGNVEALQTNGKIEYVGLVCPNPNAVYKERVIVIDEDPPKQKETSHKKERRDQDEDKEDSDFLTKLILFPFKAIWWIIKQIWRSL